MSPVSSAFSSLATAVPESGAAKRHQPRHASLTYEPFTHGTRRALVLGMTTTLYRATDDATETAIESGMCFSAERETAEAYRDNPGFGGEFLRTVELDIDESDVLDITGGLVELARELGYEDPRETATEWRCDGLVYPWEESRQVATELAEHGATWLRYSDDYPVGATTMMRI